MAAIRAKTQREREREAYEANVGREAEERYPEGHPGHWEWSYRGTPDERRELEERLGMGQHEQEEKLF